MRELIRHCLEFVLEVVIFEIGVYSWYNHYQQ